MVLMVRAARTGLETGTGAMGSSAGTDPDRMAAMEATVVEVEAAANLAIRVSLVSPEVRESAEMVALEAMAEVVA